MVLDPKINHKLDAKTRRGMLSTPLSSGKEESAELREGAIASSSLIFMGSLALSLARVRSVGRSGRPSRLATNRLWQIDATLVPLPTRPEIKRPAASAEGRVCQEPRYLPSYCKTPPMLSGKVKMESYGLSYIE